MANNIREIVTKAIIGKGKKITKDTYEINPDLTPSSVLGCWLINHEYNSYIENEKVFVSGKYDVSIWYAYDQDHHTAVCEQTIEYKDEVGVKTKGDDIVEDGLESKCTCLREPVCLSAKIDHNTNRIVLEIDKEFLVDVIGSTSLKVEVTDKNEVWDIDDIQEDNINLNYIDERRK